MTDIPTNVVIIDYASEIRNRGCNRVGDTHSTDLENVVNVALEEFNRVQDSKSRHKRIVLFNNCNFEEQRFIDAACDIARIAHGEEVEFTVVNIGVSVGNINITNHTACLTDAPDRLISVQDTKPKSFVDVIPQFVDAICYTESPTVSPTTLSPSISPTKRLSTVLLCTYLYTT